MGLEESLPNLILALVFGIGGIIAALYFEKTLNKSKEKTSERIDRLSNILKKASSEIEKLEQEVSVKSKRLKELDEHSRQLENLLSLKEEQVDAIREELRTTLKESNRNNRIWTIAIGALWFLIGIFVRGLLGF